MAINHVFTNAVADAAGVLTVWNGATTATVNATDIVRPSDWNSAHNLVYQLSGNTVGVSTVSGTNVVLAGAPNVTLSGVQGANAATISFSGGAGAAGNTGYISANGVTASLGTVEFSNSNGVTWGINGQTVTATVKTDYLTTAMASNRGSDFVQATAAFNGTNASGTIASNAISVSVAAQSVQPVAASAGNGSVAFSTLSFSNANGVSFSTAAGPAIVASHNGLTSQSNQNVTAANGGFAFQTLSFSNANGFSFGTSAGSAITGSYTVPTQTVDTAGIYALGNTTGQSSSSTYDLRTLSVEGAGFISVGWSNGSLRISGTQTNPVVSNAIQSVGSATNSGTNTSRFAADDHVHAGVFSVGVSNVGNTAGDTRVDVGRFVLAGGANITLSQATAANALNTISIVGGGGGGAFTGGMSNIGNTAGTSGTVQSQMLVVGGPNITVSQSINGQSATLSISGNAPGAAAENNWLNLLGANTAGNTTASGSTLGFSGINLTLSGTNGSVVNFSAPATSSLVGTQGISLSTNGSTISVKLRPSSYVALPPYMINSTTQTVGASTSVVWPIELRDLEEIAFLQMIQTVSLASMASIATAANNTKSYDQQGTFNFVLYTRGIGASSQSLQSVGSTSHSSRMSINIGQNANGSQWTVTHGFSFPASNGTTSFSTSYATSLTNVNVSTTHLTAVTGMKLAAFPFATTLEPQQYWAAYGFSTAQTTSGNASLSNMRVTHSNWGMSQPNNTWGAFGSANNASIQAQYGLGSYTTNGVTTASIGFSQISSSSSHVVPYLTIARIA